MLIEKEATTYALNMCMTNYRKMKLVWFISLQLYNLYIYIYILTTAGTCAIVAKHKDSSWWLCVLLHQLPAKLCVIIEITSLTDERWKNSSSLPGKLLVIIEIKDAAEFLDALTRLAASPPKFLSSSRPTWKN